MLGPQFNVISCRRTGFFLSHLEVQVRPLSDLPSNKEFYIIWQIFWVADFSQRSARLRFQTCGGGISYNNSDFRVKRNSWKCNSKRKKRGRRFEKKKKKRENLNLLNEDALIHIWRFSAVGQWKDSLMSCSRAIWQHERTAFVFHLTWCVTLHAWFVFEPVKLKTCISSMI